MHTQGKVQAQKRLEILSLHLRHVIGTETAYNNQKPQNNKLKQKLENLKEGRESDLELPH